MMNSFCRHEECLWAVPLPPSIVNLFMARKERNPFFHSIFLFLPYIDDCFCVFTDPDSVNEFLSWLNAIHETITFTMEGESQHVYFLDTTVFHNEDDVLGVKPFVKPTDRNTYLHFRSFHTLQLRTNIPYGQFLHLKRNAPEDKYFRSHAKRLRLQFLNRVYPAAIVHEAEARALTRNRDSLFKQNKPVSIPTRVNWALDHSPRSMAISSIIKKHWHLISDIPGCELPPQIGYRKSTSLRSLLVHADVVSKKTGDSVPFSGHHKCGQCNICQLTILSREIHFPEKGFSHKLTSFSNCKTWLCVYLLECFCGKKYIGSTRRQLRVRIQEHISQIKYRVFEAPLTQHFVSQQHDPLDFRVVTLESLQPSHCDMNRLLLQREAFWIFCTLAPEGLNNDLSAFI